MRRILVLAWALALLPAAASADEPADLASFFGGGKLHLRLRTAGIDLTYLEEFRAPELVKSAIAAGPGFDYGTASWYGLGIDLSVHAPQKIWAPRDKGGTALLAPGERSYAVLSVASLRGDWTLGGFRLFRQRLETPYLGARDSRIVPVTFEAYTASAAPLPGLTLLVSHVTDIKEWDSTRFVPIGEYLGLGTKAPITLGGVTWAPPKKSAQIQIWDFYIAGYANIAYAQADASFPLGKEFTLGLSLQGIDNRSVGSEALGRFRTGLAGVMGSLGWKGVSARLAGTVADRGGALLNPFNVYPGYTSIMEEDNDLAGEHAWLVGVKVDLGIVGLPGATLAWDRTKSWIPNPPLGMSHRDQKEDDILLMAELPGALKGFLVKGRAAWVQAALDTGLLSGRSLRDLRFWIDYKVDVKLTPIR